MAAEKFIKPSHLEEGEVVTRFPYTFICGCQPEKGWQVWHTPGQVCCHARLSNCRDILKRHWYRLTWETEWWHRRETCGYGNNPVHRDNRQPSPTCFASLCLLLAEKSNHMDAVHRLNGSRLVQCLHNPLHRRKTSLRYSQALPRGSL